MSMRKINTHHFRRATRTTPREINRTIVLNLVREHQPISRADLARKMNVGRGMVTLLVDDLLAEGAIREGATANSARGRKPKMLHVRTHDRHVIAVDVRFSLTSVMLSDFEGRQVALESFPTPRSPEELVEELGTRIRVLRRVHGVIECEGIGMVVPGMVDRRTGKILNSPALGWRGVEIRDALSAVTGVRVFIENAPIACALAQMWMNPFQGEPLDNFVYVTVGDGVGAGVVVNGEVLRGHGDTAGEYGHIPLNFEGPRCLCGLRGCWEAYTSNLATLGRYLELDPTVPEQREELRRSGLTVPELISRARAGDERALDTLRQTGRYLGMGMGTIINTVNPARIVVGGEILEAWELIEEIVRASARERTLTHAAAATPIVPGPAGNAARLRGATALLVARSFAAPQVA